MFWDKWQLNTVGLLVFVGVVILDVAGLALDLVLTVFGLTTVTAYIRDGHPFWAVPIVLLQVALVIGISLHFWWHFS